MIIVGPPKTFNSNCVIINVRFLEFNQKQETYHKNDKKMYCLLIAEMRKKMCKQHFDQLV